MRVPSIIIGGLILSCVGLGCASVPAPAPLCSDADQVQNSAFGVWTDLEIRAGSNAAAIDSTAKVPEPVPRIRGELIAVEQDSVYVMTLSRLVAVSRTDVIRGRLYTFDPNIGGLALWTFLGALSTASHGVGLVLSLPVWIIAGTSLAVSESHAPQVDVPGESWDNLRVFARFPQGIPPGLDRSALRYSPEAAAAQRR